MKTLSSSGKDFDFGYVYTEPDRNLSEPNRTEPNRIGFCLHGTVWNRSRGLFLESSFIFSGPESYFMSARFTLFLKLSGKIAS